MTEFIHKVTKEDDGMEDAFTAFGEFMSWVFDDRK